MSKKLVHQLLSAYEKALNSGDHIVAQLYLDAASKEMAKLQE